MNIFSKLLAKIARVPEDIAVPLGDLRADSYYFFAVNAMALWNEEPLKKKLLCALRLNWEPNKDRLVFFAREIAARELFGGPEDFGDKLLSLWAQIGNLQRDFTNLTDSDLAKSEAFTAFTFMTNFRLGTSTQTLLNLKMASAVPTLCILVYPMIAKIPIVSFKWYLNIDFKFACSMIRRSGHPKADRMLAYLYETLFLQQKIAIALAEFARLTSYAIAKKNKAALINAEITAIIFADVVFGYLKASIEKTIVLLGEAFYVSNLDSRGKHEKRVKILEDTIPSCVQDTDYGTFFFEFIKSENFDTANSYRTSLFHKAGIADLQPHTYVDTLPENAPFDKILNIMHFQHTQNTAVLHCALAMITDELCRIDPPSATEIKSFSEITEPLLAKDLTMFEVEDDDV